MATLVKGIDPTPAAKRHNLRIVNLISYSTNMHEQPLFRYSFPNGYGAVVLLVDEKGKKFDVWAGHEEASPTAMMHQEVDSTEVNVILRNVSHIEVQMMQPVGALLISELLGDIERK